MKKIIKVTLPVALAEDLEKSASASAMTKSAYIASLLKAQTGPKQGPNRAQTGPKQGPNRAQTGPKPRAHGRQREKNTVRTPLVSPQGDLFLSSFSSLFSNKPEFNCPEFELAWKRFVEMRSEPKTNPPRFPPGRPRYSRSSSRSTTCSRYWTPWVSRR